MQGFFLNKFSLKSTQVKSRKIEFLDFEIEFWSFQIEFWPVKIEFLQFYGLFCYLNKDFLLFSPKIWSFAQENRIFGPFWVPKWPSKIEFWGLRNRVSWKKNRVSQFFGKSSFSKNVQKNLPGDNVHSLEFKISQILKRCHLSEFHIQSLEV